MESFSVLMSVYYKEKSDNLVKALESVFNNTLEPDEVILVEDGPLNDSLYDVIRCFEEKYIHLRTISLPKNVGLGRALCSGLSVCSNDIVVRMDTDDIALPHRFEKQVRYLSNHKEISVVSSWIDEFVGTPDIIVSTRKVPEYDFEIVSYAKLRNPVNHPAVAFRKRDVLNAGGYMDFPLFEDYYLWVRMILNGCRFYNFQESLLLFRTDENMYARRGGWRYARLEMKFQKKLYRLKFINLWELIRNYIIRLIPRIIPNKVRMVIYRILRKI